MQTNIRKGDRVRVRAVGRWQHHIGTVHEIKVDGWNIEIALVLAGRIVWFDPSELDMYRAIGYGDSSSTQEHSVPDHDEEHCKWCQHAQVHHWWGEDETGHAVTHCRKCGATWNIYTNVIHCVMCHRTFSTPRMLEMHKIRGNKCVDPDTRTNKHGVRLFGEPNANRHGTIIWSGASNPEGWSRG